MLDEPQIKAPEPIYILYLDSSRSRKDISPPGCLACDIRNILFFQVTSWWFEASVVDFSRSTRRGL